jgi:hypothetical protein
MDHGDTEQNEFRAFLAHVGHTQSSFARAMKDMGDDRTTTVILRHVQRLVAGDVRISGEMRVIMFMMRAACNK